MDDLIDPTYRVGDRIKLRDSGQTGTIMETPVPADRYSPIGYRVHLDGYSEDSILKQEGIDYEVDIPFEGPMPDLGWKIDPSGETGPDTLPWGEDEQEYYRRAKTAGLDLIDIDPFTDRIWLGPFGETTHGLHPIHIGDSTVKAVNVMDGETIAGSAVYFVLNDPQLLQMIGEDQPVMGVEWIGVKPEYRQTSAFLEMGKKIVEEAGNLPIKAMYQNQDLKRVVERLEERRFSAVYDQPEYEPTNLYKFEEYLLDDRLVVYHGPVIKGTGERPKLGVGDLEFDHLFSGSGRYIRLTAQEVREAKEEGRLVHYPRINVPDTLPWGDAEQEYYRTSNDDFNPDVEILEGNYLGNDNAFVGVYNINDNLMVIAPGHRMHASIIEEVGDVEYAVDREYGHFVAGIYSPSRTFTNAFNIVFSPEWINESHVKTFENICKDVFASLQQKTADNSGEIFELNNSDILNHDGRGQDNRRPVGFDTNNKKAYIGSPGSHHSELMEAIEELQQEKIDEYTSGRWKGDVLFPGLIFDPNRPNQPNIIEDGRKAVLNFFGKTSKENGTAEEIDTSRVRHYDGRHTTGQRPIVYDLNTKTVYIGNINDHHIELMEAVWGTHRVQGNIKVDILMRDGTFGGHSESASDDLIKGREAVRRLLRIPADKFTCYYHDAKATHGPVVKGLDEVGQILSLCSKHYNNLQEGILGVTELYE